MNPPAEQGAEPPASPRGMRRALEAIRTWRPERVGLRARVLLMFFSGALLLSVFLGAVAFTFTRSSLINQRDGSGVDQVINNARVARSELIANPSSAQDAINLLVEFGVAEPALLHREVWTPGTARFEPDVIPPSLLSRVADDRTPSRMIILLDGAPVLAVGIPLDDVGAAYFELVPLAEIDDTLESVALSLLFAGIITTMAGVLLGWLAASRAVRPLGAAAQAAKAIAGGRLDTRLEPTDDHDLRLLANSFNDMAAALQQRVERDARFTSDVSHELRSPLMTLAASAEVMNARREELPERLRAALDLLVSDVTRFQGLVEDLLEISRFDAGAIRLQREELLVAEFVRHAVTVSSVPSTPVEVSPRAEQLVISGDRRRLARVVANLIDNARIHGTRREDDTSPGVPVPAEPGITVTVTEAEGEGEPLGHVWIVVEDHGPGVPVEERAIIFERFARGAVAGRRRSNDGAGLGLALVNEHVRLHGGRVWVEDRADGAPGARFVLELPAEDAGP